MFFDCCFAAISRFCFVVNDVCESELGRLVVEFGFIAGPIAERGPEPVNRDIETQFVDALRMFVSGLF